jgi:tetratricopeptide (TPR) repeat protein
MRYVADNGAMPNRRKKMRANTFRISALLAAGALGVALAPNFAAAVDSSGSTVQPPSQTQSGSGSSTSTTSGDKKKNTNTKKDKKSDRQFLDGYKAAHVMIYQQSDYAGGIAKLRALGHDDHPDVANLIGFSSRKLGRYDDAKLWYEKALAANPNHTLTWSYYGMWHAEQGNVLKARDHLEKVQSICGTECREYVMLKEVIDGSRTY